MEQEVRPPCQRPAQPIQPGNLPVYITYEKGASVLRQLVSYVGQDAFFEGVRAYFKQHAWGNTRLADLLSALEASSGRDMAAWSTAWLENAGVNVLAPEIEADEQGTITRLAVRQEAPPLPAGADGQAVLRPHRLAIGMYDLIDGGLVRTGRIELDVEGPLTEVPLDGPLTRPTVLLLNNDDLTYAKIRLDPVSLAGVTNHLADFADSLPRALRWAAAWDMTRDGEMAARDYATIVLRSIGREPDITVVQAQQRNLKFALEHYADDQWREQGLLDYADEALRLLRQASPGSDHQLAWAQAFASVARTDAHADALRGLLHGTFVLDGLAVDSELRWALLRRLSALGLADQAQIDAELESDTTALGQQHAAACRAALPTPEAKKAAWAAVVEAQTLTNTIQRSVIDGFTQPDQRELRVRGRLGHRGQPARAGHLRAGADDLPVRLRLPLHHPDGAQPDPAVRCGGRDALARRAAVRAEVGRRRPDPDRRPLLPLRARRDRPGGQRATCRKPGGRRASGLIRFRPRLFMMDGRHLSVYSGSRPDDPAGRGHTDGVRK